MGNKYRQPPSDMVRSQLKVIDRIEVLENSPRSVSTNVDTGNWKFIGSNGAELVKFGQEAAGYGEGWVFRRSNNNAVLWLGGAPDMQYFALSDNAGNTIFSDNTDSSGEGIARPYIPYSSVKTADIFTPPVTTTSTTFTSAFTTAGRRQHPIIEVQFIILTPAGVSAEVQLADNTGLVVAGPQSYGGSIFEYDWIRGNLPYPLFGDFSLDLQFRVSAGAGTIKIMQTYAYGKQA